MSSTLLAAAIFCAVGLACAQTGVSPRRPDAKAPELRATGVLEWTGEMGKPSASRLIPIAVFAGNRYQDASVYMARPEPMAVEGDTEYELQQAGIPKGRFDIFSAGNVQGSWFGYGVWKPLIEVKVPKLSASKVMPEVVRDADPDRPHLSTGKANSDKPDTAKPASKDSPNKDSPSKDSPSKDSPEARAGTEPHISSTSSDPDRPKLRKRPQSETAGNTPGDPVSAMGEADPDRPKLHRGIPAAAREAGKLTGTPPSLQQMVALSTTTNEEPHSYVYQWVDPADATKMQTALEKLAREALAEQHAPEAIGAAHKVPARAARSAKTVPLATALVVEDFRTFELSYSAGATIVFACRTAGEAVPGNENAVKYVTLIAQPDFYGSPRVIYKQVTDSGHLDATPRMKLIDAVDTNGDHRAEFIFELRGRAERRFAIYSIASGRAEQVFLTSEVP